MKYKCWIIPHTHLLKLPFSLKNPFEVLEAKVTIVLNRLEKLLLAMFLSMKEPMKCMYLG